MQLLTPVCCLVVDDDEAMVEMWRGLLAPWSVRRLPLMAPCPAASAHDAMEDVLDGAERRPDLVLVRADLATRGGEATDRGRRDWAGLALAARLQAGLDRAVPLALYGVLPPPRFLQAIPFVSLPEECGQARVRLEKLLPAARIGPSPCIPPRLRDQVTAVSRCLARIGPAFLALCDTSGRDAPGSLEARARAFWEGPDWQGLCVACRALYRRGKALELSDPLGFRLPERICDVDERLGALEWALPRREPPRVPELLAEYRDRYLASSRILDAWMRGEQVEPPGEEREAR